MERKLWETEEIGFGQRHGYSTVWGQGQPPNELVRELGQRARRSQTFKDQGSPGGQRNLAPPGAQRAWGRHASSEGRPPLG